MNNQELHYFLTIVKHQNLTKASQELYISQPTLSKFLQKLEKELGGKVFRRSGHTYTLTFLGQRYLEYAQKVLLLNQDWQKELSDMRSSFSGELNIAFPPMRGACLIPQILPTFHQKYPGVHVNFYEKGHSIQEELLSNATLDFAIFSEWQPLPTLTYHTLLLEEILLVLCNDSPFIQQAALKEGCRYPWLDLGLLAENPFILHFQEQNTGRAACSLFKQYKIQPPVPFHTRDSHTCIQLTAKGLGACFAPESYVRYLSDSYPIQAFSVGNPPCINRLVIGHRKNSYLSTYAQEFIRITKECLMY